KIEPRGAVRHHEVLKDAAARQAVSNEEDLLEPRRQYGEVLAGARAEVQRERHWRAVRLVGAQEYTHQRVDGRRHARKSILWSIERRRQRTASGGQARSSVPNASTGDCPGAESTPPAVERSGIPASHMFDVPGTMYVIV